MYQLNWYYKTNHEWISNNFSSWLSFYRLAFPRKWIHPSPAALGAFPAFASEVRPCEKQKALCHLIWNIWGQSFCLNRKDPHGFFSFPVTDAIAPGYSMIIKHPMDFSTMKDKIAENEYKTITEFKVRTCPATIFIFRLLEPLMYFSPLKWHSFTMWLFCI